MKICKGMIFRQLKYEPLIEQPPNTYRVLKVVGFSKTEHYGRRAICEVRYYKNLETTSSWTQGKNTSISISRLDDTDIFWKMPILFFGDDLSTANDDEKA
jgi:hypothetical protein